jgi:V/A-type H+-transporting ATPase subunit I
VLSFDAEGWRHDLAVGSATQLLALSQLTAAAKGHWHAPPAWLQCDPATHLAAAAARLAALDVEARQLRELLAALAAEHALHRALADARRLHWVLDNVHGLEAGEWLTWIVGWTSTGAATLEAAVERAGARALLRLGEAPREAAPPMLLANPAWARPFEVFARALGMPSRTEADPSALLAIAVPLMFGYMFGDVGQGLVIAAAGFALRKRFALARLFIAGGLAAAFFGWVFGSVFSLHLLHPLWLAPLADPLAVLVAPLYGGAALLALGLALSALQAHWRGELSVWLITDAGYVLCYLALVAALLVPQALWVAAGGAALFCLGHAAHQRRATAALAAVGELVERLLQVLINTLSFARVGAFALAHAGLSSAIAALMAAAPNAFVATLVVVAGNAVVIVLEGLVVSIQTTRLVLFEFFARFLSGQGRVFRPLPLPPSTAPQGLRAQRPGVPL